MAAFYLRCSECCIYFFYYVQRVGITSPPALKFCNIKKPSWDIYRYQDVQKQSSEKKENSGKCTFSNHYVTLLEMKHNYIANHTNTLLKKPFWITLWWVRTKQRMGENIYLNYEEDSHLWKNAEKNVSQNECFCCSVTPWSAARQASLLLLLLRRFNRVRLCAAP